MLYAIKNVKTGRLLTISVNIKTYQDSNIYGESYTETSTEIELGDSSYPDSEPTYTTSNKGTAFELVKKGKVYGYPPIQIRIDPNYGITLKDLKVVSFKERVPGGTKHPGVKNG